MTVKTLRWLRFVAILWVIGAVFFLAARALDVDELRHTLREARWGYAVPSTALNVLTVGIIVLRWHTLLNFRARYLDCLSANQVGAYMNNLLPFRLGDFTRSYLLRRHAPELSVVAILSSIGAELTFDMMILMILLAGVVTLLPLPALLTQAGALLAVLTAAAAVGVFTLGRSDHAVERLVRPLARRWLPDGLQKPLLHMVERVQDGLSSLRSNRQVLIVLALTLLGYTVQVVSNGLLLKVFIADAPSYAGLVALVGAGVGLALPLLPGSAGTYELAVALALTSIGIEPTAAAAFALVLRGQQFGMTLVLGSFFMLKEGVNIKELRQAAEAR